MQHFCSQVFSNIAPTADWQVSSPIPPTILVIILAWFTAQMFCEVRPAPSCKPFAIRTTRKPR